MAFNSRCMGAIQACMPHDRPAPGQRRSPEAEGFAGPAQSLHCGPTAKRAVARQGQIRPLEPACHGGRQLENRETVTITIINEDDATVTVQTVGEKRTVPMANEAITAASQAWLRAGWDAKLVHSLI